ncbi:MAG: hypothetical protein V4632_11915 [Pseudomonadota bacterium]
MGRTRNWLSVSFFLLLTAAAYWTGLAGGFTFDDKPNIVDNPVLRLFDGSLSSLIAASTGGSASPLGRPVSMATFAVNLYFHGTLPFYFKLVNLLIHLANGVLVFVLVRQLWPHLLRQPAGNKTSAAALWITAVWLLHPINLTPVLFVVQRMTSLAAFFTLAALCLYLYGRRTAGPKAWMAIAASVFLFWPMAVFSKETGLLLPFFIIVCEWLAFNSFDRMPRKAKWLAAGAAGIVLALLVATRWDLIMNGYQFREFNLHERLLTEARVLWFYLLQLLLPLPDLFALFHDDIPISRSLLSPPHTLLAIIGWIVVIAAALHQRKKRPLFTFATAWFLAAHLLESTVLPLEIAYEHRNYLASLGILIWLAALLFPPHAPEKGKVPRLVLATSFVLFCGFVTCLRAAQWSDEYRRTQIEVAIHPNSPRANHEAGLAIVEKTFYAGSGSSLAYQMARFHFQQAVALDPQAKAPLIGMLYLDCAAGAPKVDSLRLALRDRFAKGPMPPGDRVIVQNLSQLLVENRLCMEDAEVRALLDAALSNPAADGRMRGMLNAVGMDHAMAKMGSIPLALKYARAAVENDGGAALRINLVHVLMASGDMEEARREYTVLASSPIAARDQVEVEQLRQKLKSMESNTNAR